MISVHYASFRVIRSAFRQAFFVTRKERDELMIPIHIHNLTFAYDGQPPLFKDCSLDFNSDWKLGLLGRNGRGKTTFFRLLQGQLPYQGSIQAPPNIAYFPLKVADQADFAWDVVQQNLPQLAQWQVERELSKLHLDPTILWQPYQTLSGGEQTKLMLGAIFAQADVFILLDEPTNHLDQASRRLVADYLQHQKQGFIVTSHDRTFVDQVIDHTMVLERQQIIVEQGNYSRYLAQKKRRDQTALTQNERLQKSIKQLHTAQQQRQQWAQKAENKKLNNAHADKSFLGAKAAKMMKKSVTLSHRIDQQINEKEGLLQEVDSIVPLTINQQQTHHQTLLQLSDVALTINGQQLFANLSATMHNHDQLALCGPNGSGKSSLFAAILGKFSGQMTGQITVANQLQISVVRQHFADNRGTLRKFAEAHHLPFADLLNMLRKLGMARQTFETRIEDMSLGQQKKVELARSLVEPAQLYLWDEPLNYLDIYNQNQLIQLIKETRPPLLFIEHDAHFIAEVATQQINLADLTTV